MLHTTRAIVLRTIRHGDHKAVITAFTERFGLRAYVVHLSRRNGITTATLQPLSRLELVVDERHDRELHQVREIRVEAPYERVHGDPVRSSLMLFVQEILLRTLREEAANQQLFHFVRAVTEVIDHAEDLSHFPLVFLLRLSAHLGFLPSAPAEGETTFDLLEGHFVQGEAPSGHGLKPPLSMALAHLLTCKLSDPISPAIPLVQRRDLLEQMLLYYRMQIEDLAELRSPAVLKQILE